jgi:hypothetical protein
MKTKNILQVCKDEQGRIHVDVPSADEAVIGLYSYITGCREGGHALFDILFSVTIHLAAAEESGRFLDEYIKSLREYVAELRAAVMNERDIPVS